MDDKKKKTYVDPEAEIINFENELDTLVDSGEGNEEAGYQEGWFEE